MGGAVFKKIMQLMIDLITNNFFIFASNCVTLRAARITYAASEDMRDCSSRPWLLGLFYFDSIVFEPYRFVTIIIKVTATTEIKMPVMMLEVRASPNTKVPTRIAVIGSKTPNTEALVAPIFLVEIARSL
mgnify:CR=1 FL=1